MLGNPIHDYNWDEISVPLIRNFSISLNGNPCVEYLTSRPWIRHNRTKVLSVEPGTECGKSTSEKVLDLRQDLDRRVLVESGSN